jgi:oligopeptide/dipeptide ABC transporter ATP-binding protein
MDRFILDIRDLKKYFPQRRDIAFWRRPGEVKAVDGISLSVIQGETFGLVGESGCGKSTIGKVVLKVLNPTAGQISFMDQQIEGLRGDKLFRFRQNIQAVYQDPYSSLNPRMCVGDIIGEPITTLGVLAGKEREQRVSELLEKVGLSPEHGRRYPHEFSGGQRQRIGIARALSVRPSFVVLDEPVSALDVSIRSQILNLLSDLQEEFGLTYFFISHDLSVVEYLCDHVAVMYLGKIVEKASKDNLFQNPCHPYTKALLSAVPVPDPETVLNVVPLTGEIPTPLNPPTGCRFHPRCPSRREICDRDSPEMIQVEEDHNVSCHLSKC